MQVALPDPGHCTVADVVDTAVQVRHLAHTGYHLSLRRIVEAWLHGIRVVPENRVLFVVVDTVTG